MILIHDRSLFHHKRAHPNGLGPMSILARRSILPKVEVLPIIYDYRSQSQLIDLKKLKFKKEN